MPDQANAVSRSWRRYLRFSVRGLIVLVLVIGAGMGWIVRSARIQREAVAAIVNDRGGVLYDWEWSNGEFIPGGKLRRRGGSWILLESTTSVTLPKSGSPKAQRHPMQ